MNSQCNGQTEQKLSQKGPIMNNCQSEIMTKIRNNQVTEIGKCKNKRVDL